MTTLRNRPRQKRRRLHAPWVIHAAKVRYQAAMRRYRHRLAAVRNAPTPTKQAAVLDAYLAASGVRITSLRGR